MIINYFLNTIFLKVVKTKSVNNYRAYIRKKNNMIKYNICLLRHLNDSGQKTIYEKLSKGH